MKKPKHKPKRKPLARVEKHSADGSTCGFDSYEVMIGDIFVVDCLAEKYANKLVMQINRAAEAWAKARGK